MSKTRKDRLRIGALVAGFGALVTAEAGTATYDFNSAPPPELKFVGGPGWTDPNTGEQILYPEWRATGGVDNSGYLSLFDSVDGQHATVLIPDFDAGLVVKAFTFEVDLRIGNPTGDGAPGQGNFGRPADGFSISYAHADDPVVLDMVQDPPVDNIANFSLANAPENGTRTGLAISFDTWQGNVQPDGGADIEGIMLNINGRVIPVNGLRGIPMPTRNGSCTDATSMQTGPFTNGEEGSGPSDVSGLCWARLKVEVDEASTVTVTWKGTVIADHVPTGFAPTAGRIVFAGRTGGANENTHIDNLTITTVPADKALYAGGTANAEGYTLLIVDSGPSVVDESTLAVKIDDVTVTPTSVSKQGATTTIIVRTAPNWLASGSVHTAEVRFKDTQGTDLGDIRSITVPAYPRIPPAMEVTGVTKPGFLMRTWYLTDDAGIPLPDMATTNERAEQELFGELGANAIDNPDELAQTIPGTANKYFVETEYLNHDQSQIAQGMFTENAVDPQLAAPEKQIPGIFPADLNNMALEALFFVEFTQAGLHTFGCNSDDGFRVYAGKNPLDRFQVDGVMLGEFNAGRGTATTPQTLFSFLVQDPGFYPLRFIWQEGGGGANFELYQQLADGTFALINDTARASGVVKAFWDGPRTARAYISKVSPGVGDFNIGFNDPVEITVTDDGTAVVDGSVELQVNGADVTPTVTKTGKNTVVRYVPPADRQWVTGPNTLRITYDETGGGSRDQSFTIRIFPQASAVPANSFTIEAEHFDNNGQAAAGISGSGYTGDEYLDLAAVHNVDYFQNEDQQDPGSLNYRTGESPNVPMDANTGAGTLDVQRPGFEVTTNFKVGWVAGGEWYNYKRTIPAGIYTAYAAQSVDPAASIGGSVGLVTEGAGTATQTVKNLADITGTPPGGWGNNGLLPAVSPTGGKGVFKLPGGEVTLRYTTRGGDFDWFTISPTTAPAQLVSTTPDLRFSIPRDAVLTWIFEDFTTTINTTTVKLKINGADVGAPDFTVTAAGGVTTAKYDAAALFDTGKTYAYELAWSDSAGAPSTSSGSFIAHFMPDSPANMFLVEAEDFNTGGGQVQAAVNTMPYLGNAYDGLGATVDIDYDRGDAVPDGNIYRLNEDPNVPMGTDGDLVRARDAAGAATWTLTASYRLGWSGGGNWMNYTRQVPAGDYQVWASMSYGEAPGATVRAIGNLRKVTSDPTQANQTTENIGFFRGPATGGWGSNQLFPLRLTDATSGDAAVVNLSGATTFQFEYASSDFDYMMLVPSTALPQIRFTSIRKNTDGTVTVEWTGGGTLQAGPSVVGPWQDVTGATSPYTLTPSEAMLFGRIRQ